MDNKELLQSRFAFVKVNQNQLGVLRVQQRSKLEFTQNKSINLRNKQAGMQIFNERCKTKIHLLGFTKIRSIGTHPHTPRSVLKRLTVGKKQKIHSNINKFFSSFFTHEEAYIIPIRLKFFSSSPRRLNFFSSSSHS